MSAAEAGNPVVETIGAQLERLRLQRRVGQLELVLRRLRDRARADDACAVERTGLHRAAAEFAAELKQIRARLDTPAQPSNPTDDRARRTT